MKSRVAVVAEGMTKFGKREASWRDLAAEAGKATLEGAKNLSREDIDTLIVATADEEVYLSAYVAEILGLRPKHAFKLENLCDSGGSAISTAYAYISSGLAKAALVLGVEKMTHRDFAPQLYWDFTRGGITPPIVWGAMYARRHMAEFGTTEEQLAMISVKNHNFAASNPYAHFQKPIDIDQVMASKKLIPPIKLFDCSPLSDGAAGLILTSEEKAGEVTDTPVYVAGVGQSTTGATFGNVNREFTSWPATVLAAKDSYAMAEVSPKMIDVAEVHDAFTINEIIAYEDLGFAERGRGGQFVQEGRADVGGDVAVNTRGGLIGAGHPIGATGVAQAAQLVRQLQGEAGKNQVSGAELGLMHNLSAAASTCSVLIFKREN